MEVTPILVAYYCTNKNVLCAVTPMKVRLNVYNQRKLMSTFFIFHSKQGDDKVQGHRILIKYVIKEMDMLRFIILKSMI